MTAATSPFRFEGSEAVLRLTGSYSSLAAGGGPAEEVCISYGPEEGRMASDDRRRALMEQYR